MESWRKDDRFSPFSNGTEWQMWLGRNCCRGERGCRRYRPDASSSRDGCPIEVAVALAGVTDGLMPVRIGLRGGWLAPGPGGVLVRVESEGEAGCAVIPACPEFRGYDEPDGRPRRGPKPSPGQIDLLDPRPVDVQILA